MNVMPIVGQHLRDARIKHEFYRIMMADALDVPYKEIEKIEKGEVDISYELVYNWYKAINEYPLKEIKEILPQENEKVILFNCNTNKCAVGFIEDSGLLGGGKWYWNDMFISNLYDFTHWISI